MAGVRLFGRPLCFALRRNRLIGESAPLLVSFFSDSVFFVKARFVSKDLLTVVPHAENVVFPKLFIGLRHCALLHLVSLIRPQNACWTLPGFSEHLCGSQSFTASQVAILATMG